MSDNDDDLANLLAEELGDAPVAQQAPTAPAATEDDGSRQDEGETRRHKKDKSSKKHKKDKKHKKHKKKSGKRRQRDEETSSDEDVDEDDIIDWDKDDIVSSGSSEDDDDDGDGDNGNKNKKKSSKKRKGAAFVRDGMSDDDADEDFVDDEAEIDNDDTSYLDNYKRPKDAFGEELVDENLDDAELARRIEERHRARKAQQQQGAAGAGGRRGAGRGAARIADADEDEGFFAREIDDDTAQFSAAFMSRPDDAKVFSVKIRGGFSKLLVHRLVNKCDAYLRGNNVNGIRQDLGILSVFSLPHVSDFIYVESHRQKFVETALAGLDGCFRFRITELRPDAVMQLFTAPVVSQLGNVVHKGELLRVRTATYRLDLAEVVDVLEDGKRVLCRLLPRLDFVGKEYEHVKGPNPFRRNTGDNNNSNNNQSANRNSNTAARPPQRLFAPSLAIGADTRGTRVHWGPHEFDENGYLLKDFTIRQLFVGTARGLVSDPTPQELRNLFQFDTAALQKHLMTSKPADAPLQYTSATRVVYFSERFHLNDPIRVVKGQLAGVTGRIEEIQPAMGRAAVRVAVPRHQQLQQLQMASGEDAALAGPVAPATTTLTIDLTEACKLFHIGDQIAVERGPHHGDTGVVLNAEGMHLTFFSDCGKGHCTCEANDCSSAFAANPNPNKVGQWRLFDLVVLVDDRTVGCIVSLGPDSAELLTESNSAVRVPLSTIKHKAETRGTKKPTDAFGNQIFPARDTAVEVLSVQGAPTLFAGRVCHVKAVYENTIFVRCAEVRQHAGIGAVSCKVVRLMSGLKRADLGGAAASLMNLSKEQEESVTRLRMARGEQPQSRPSPLPDTMYALPSPGQGSAAYTTAYQ